MQPSEKERKRLIDLLDYQEHCRFCDMCHESPETRAASLNALVDHLLANGVRALPVNVGETVYKIFGEICSHFAECDNWCGAYDKKCASYEGVKVIAETQFSLNMLDEIGKTVFLTREDAERAVERIEG